MSVLAAVLNTPSSELQPFKGDITRLSIARQRTVFEGLILLG